MRAALKMIEPQKRAIAGAKFRAWWDGATFDEAAFLAARETAAAAEPANLENELFDAPRDPRLDGLARLWGQGRIMPAGDDAARLALLALPENAALALLGPGHAGAVTPYVGAASVSVYEWRPETRAALEQALAPAPVTALDLDLTTFPAEQFDGLISFDDFTYSSNPNRLALQIARTLKLGAKAVIETYVALPGSIVAPAFASAFAEPQVHAPAALAQAMNEAGLDFEADEDVTAAHIAEIRAALTAFAEAAAAEAAQPSAAEAREIGWEIQTWRARLKLLAHGQLQRRRILAHRRA